MIFHFGAKTFIVGEYAALVGGPALIAITQPKFEFKVIKASELTGLHPDSPAGKLAKKNSSPLSLERLDQVPGGLGASTAEYLAVKKFTSPGTTKISLADLHEYQEFAKTSDSSLKPSGYDLIAQTFGGLCAIQVDETSIKQKQMHWGFKGLSMMLFYTGIKLKTHEHLADLKTFNFKKLSEISADVIKHLESASQEKFLEGIQNFAAELSDLKLVSQPTQDLLNQIKTDPSVLAVKGCGAMGSDVICVFCRQKDQSQVETKILSLSPSLKLIATEKSFT